MTTHVQYTPPGEGIRHVMIDGVHIVKVGAEATGGAYEVFEVEAPQAPPAPPHRSPWAAALYLLDGALTVHVDGRSYQLAPGATVAVPAGAAYTVEVTGAAARFLAFTTGDGAGRLFADLAATVPADRPFAEIMPLLQQVIRRHSVTVA
ncbi:cupin domain-containing protein [Prauserella muralis]|nr:cupin domain-containing protein [Prauserella muralis]TWE27694.1 cupin domain [Prauserella muralis]